MELDLALIEKAKESLEHEGSAWDLLTLLKPTYTSTIPLILALRAVLPLGLQEAIRLATAEPSQEADLRALYLPRLLLFCHRGPSGPWPEAGDSVYRFFKDAAFEGREWLTVVSAEPRDATVHGRSFPFWHLPSPSTALSPEYGSISGARMTMADLQTAFHWALSVDAVVAEHLAVTLETPERVTCRFRWP